MPDRKLAVLMLPFACLIVAASSLSADTLRQAIVANRVDPNSLCSPNLDETITGRSEFGDSKVFLIAYYLDNGPASTCGPIRIELLDKEKNAWRHSEIIQGSLEYSGGSITSIHHSKNGFYLYAHINPSAGALIILSPTLDVRGSVFGSFLCDYDNGMVVYSRSTVHFAPTHPGGVSVYDPKTKTDRAIYPMKPYQEVRLAHIAKVKAAYDRLGEDWFRINNHHGDPELFTNGVHGDAAASDATDSLAFVVSFDNSETLSAEGQCKLGYFNEVRRGIKEHLRDARVASRDMEALCDALRQGFARAERAGVDAQLLALFDQYPGVRDMISALINAKVPDHMPRGEYLLTLDSRWQDSETWQAIAQVVESPPEFTEVVYLYRNVCKADGLEYRELLFDDVKRRFGDVPLSDLLKPEALRSIFSNQVASGMPQPAPTSK